MAPKLPYRGVDVGRWSVSWSVCMSMPPTTPKGRVHSFHLPLLNCSTQMAPVITTQPHIALIYGIISTSAPLWLPNHQMGAEYLRMGLDLDMGLGSGVWSNKLSLGVLCSRCCYRCYLQIIEKFVWPD